MARAAVVGADAAGSNRQRDFLEGARVSDDSGSNESFLTSYPIAAVAGVFYAASATMFLAATQTWGVHLARQAFLSCSRTALYVAGLITVIEAVLIVVRALPTPKMVAIVIGWVALLLSGWIILFGGLVMYQDMKPIEACISGNNSACIAN